MNGSFSDIIRGVMNKFGISAPDTDPAVPDVSVAPPLQHYPDKADVENARANDFSYGSGNEGFDEGRVARVLGMPAAKARTVGELTRPASGRTVKGNPDLAQNYEAAQLAINRSPISALGYDPRAINIDASGKPDPAMYGLFAPSFDPGGGGIYSNPARPSNLVHESTHRGMAQLRNANAISPELAARLPPDEEDIVRYIMATQMGDPEHGPPGNVNTFRNSALFKFGAEMEEPNKSGTYFADPRAEQYRTALEELTKIAAQQYAKRRPGGPR